MQHRRGTRVAFAIALAVTIGRGAGARAATYEAPNLTPVPPYAIQIGASDPGSVGAMALRFTTAIEDRGPYAFDVLGAPSDLASAADAQDGIAYECVQWTLTACASRLPAGAFTWDPLHDHFHLGDVARYELRALQPDGLPDLSPAGLIASQNKISFCMEDTQPGSSYAVTNPASAIPAYSFCTQVLQGISPGWEDIYGSGLPGQQIDLNGIADGDYALVVRLNVDHRFLESSFSDNESFTPIRLSAGGTQVTVL